MDYKNGYIKKDSNLDLQHVKSKHSYTFDKYIRWCNHFGKHSGGCLKMST